MTEGRRLMKFALIGLPISIGVGLFALISHTAYVLADMQVPETPKAPAVEIRQLEAANWEEANRVAGLDPNPNAHFLSGAEEGAVRALASTILKRVNDLTRNGCGDRNHPEYFPQHPKLVISYQGGGFAQAFWAELRKLVRNEAPAATLLAYNEAVLEAYYLDILGARNLKGPLATVAYRHSAILGQFGSDYASRPIFGEYQPPANELPSKLVRSEAKLAGWDGFYSTMTISKGNFYFSEGEHRELLKESPEFPRVSEAIKSFELTLPKEERMDGSWYKEEELTISIGFYLGRGEEMKVVAASMYPPPNFSGFTRMYLLVKAETEWQVVDTSTIEWTDFVHTLYCREP